MPKIPKIVVKKLSKKLKEFLKEYARDADPPQGASTLQHNVRLWINKTPKERTQIIEKVGGRGWHERNAIDPIKAFKFDSPKASLTEDVVSSIKKAGVPAKKRGGGMAVKKMNRGGTARRSKPRGVGAAERGYGRAMR